MSLASPDFEPKIVKAAVDMGMSRDVQSARIQFRLDPVLDSTPWNSCEFSLVVSDQRYAKTDGVGGDE